MKVIHINLGILQLIINLKCQNKAARVEFKLSVIIVV